MSFKMVALRKNIYDEITALRRINRSSKNGIDSYSDVIERLLEQQKKGGVYDI